ncbi:uncharacterized protein ISCGN_016124 [Ixodes scapularis]
MKLAMQPLVCLLASLLLASVDAGYEDQEVYAPQPYQFGYETQDEYGNRQSRHEQDAGNGVKTGSYGYRDAYGLFRQVQYVADSGGFRAWVKTNEPGTQDSAPAAAKIESQQPHPSALAAAHTAAHYAVAAHPRAVHLSPAFSSVRKVPVHHSLYPVGAATARHASIQRAYSHQVPQVYKHSFRRLAVAAPVAAPVTAPLAAPVHVPVHAPVSAPVQVPVHAPIAEAPVVPVARALVASPQVALPPVVSALASSPVVVDLDQGGPYRAVKKVRRPKPVEFFKKSIIRKRRPKTPRVRVRVVSTTKNGELIAADLPVYKDK